MRLPSSVAILGTGLDVTYEAKGQVLKLDCAGLTVAGDVDGRTVWIMPSPERTSRKKLDQVPRARRLREQWSHLEAGEVLDAKVRVGAKTERLGVVRTIGYRSNKFSGRKVDYEHKYSSSPVLSRSGNVYRISGGNQRIRPEGITG